MNSDLVVKSTVGHVLVNLCPSISFAETKTLEMHRQGFVYNIVQWLVLQSRNYVCSICSGVRIPDYYKTTRLMNRVNANNVPLVLPEEQANHLLDTILKLDP